MYFFFNFYYITCGHGCGGICVYFLFFIHVLHTVRPRASSSNTSASIWSSSLHVLARVRV
jgi:hypothetical protein